MTETFELRDITAQGRDTYRVTYDPDTLEILECRVQPAQSPLESAIEKLSEETAKSVHLEPREAAAVLKALGDVVGGGG